MSKSNGAAAVTVFLFILAFPLFYNLVSVGVFGASSAAPEIVEPEKGECVRGEEWMRHNHMLFLLHERDEVVREGVRTADHGIQGCRRCHSERDKFCDRCHGYVGVEPECWNCHNYPAGKAAS